MNYWDYVFKIAMFTVGVTQLVKQFVPTKNNKIKVILTVSVGAIGGIFLYYLPQEVFLTIVGISVGVVFYDGILKLIEKRINAFDKDMKREEL